MITIFTIPKAFSGLINIIQRNALHSWTILKPVCEVILCGDELGVKEVASEFGVQNLTNIRYNEFGTPLINSVFLEVAKISKFSLLCYLNADIILFNSFLDAISRIKFSEFLMVGRRTNLDVIDQLDFNKNWESELIAKSKIYGQISGPEALDYFVFTPNKKLEVLPPFAVGRPRWDNYFVFNALRYNIPIIDSSKVCTVIHQNHDYRHVHKGDGKTWKGPEADSNYNLYKQNTGTGRYFTIEDSSHYFTKKFLLPCLTPKYMSRRLQTTAILHPRFRVIVKFLIFLIQPRLLISIILKNIRKQ